MDITKNPKPPSLPLWTHRITSDDRAGEDHLGLESAAQNYQQDLIPGIISTTDHARYYSFYSWVLYRFIHHADGPGLLENFSGQYFRRHEVAYILACYSHHKDGTPYKGIIGAGNNMSKARDMWQSGDPISLDANYFTNKLGGFGQYYRPAMERMGLVGPNEDPRKVYKITPRGLRLAQAFEASIQGTAYLNELEAQGEPVTLSRSAAAEYGSRACLCSEAVSRGEERELLLDTFLRFDHAHPSPIDNPHHSRRLTLGLLLDMVSRSSQVPMDDALTRVLYLRQFSIGQDFGPHPAFREWFRRWQTVQIRHVYTAAVQALWAVFLDRLKRTGSSGTSFNEFMVWVTAQLGAGTANLPVNTYLDRLCADVNLPQPWQVAAGQFGQACRKESRRDEHTLYLQIASNRRRDPTIIVGHAVRILCQFFLRWYPDHAEAEPLWQEMAARKKQRLPITNFYLEMLNRLNTGAQSSWSVSELLSWLYRDYILGEHEYVALDKLHRHGYDTFKFYFEDPYFYWADNPKGYKEPIRFAGLRLHMALRMLVDLGLVERNPGGICRLTDDGQAYLTRIIEHEEASGGN